MGRKHSIIIILGALQLLLAGPAAADSLFWTPLHGARGREVAELGPLEAIDCQDRVEIEAAANRSNDSNELVAELSMSHCKDGEDQLAWEISGKVLDGRAATAGLGWLEGPWHTRLDGPVPPGRSTHRTHQGYHAVWFHNCLEVVQVTGGHTALEPKQCLWAPRMELSTALGLSQPGMDPQLNGVAAVGPQAQAQLWLGAWYLQLGLGAGISPHLFFLDGEDSGTQDSFKRSKTPHRSVALRGRYPIKAFDIGAELALICRPKLTQTNAVRGGAQLWWHDLPAPIGLRVDVEKSTISQSSTLSAGLTVDGTILTLRPFGRFARAGAWGGP
jgi:hypothetical protein